MTLNQLRYFMTLARCLNFSRAAQELYVSQPTLSYQISELEKDLGTQLFVRDKRKVFLTPAGKQIVDRVKLVLSTVDDIAEFVRDYTQETDKPRSLSIVLDNADERFESLGITDALTRFIRDNPAANLEVESRTFMKCIEGLKSGENDLAILTLRANDTPDPEVNIFPIMEDRFGLAYARNVKVANMEELLNKLPLLYSDELPRARNQMENALRLNNINCSMKEVTDFNVSIILAECGKGILAMPQHLHDYYFADRLNFMPLEYDWARIALCACWNISNTNTAIQQLINEFN